MNINLNTNHASTPYAENGLTGVQQTAEASTNGAKLKPVNVTMSKAETAGIEPTATIPDSALVRDDPLGKIVETAFSLPPPPMPAFS